MDRSEWKQLHLILLACSSELLTEIGLPDRIEHPEDPPEHAEQVAAYVGFSGEPMRGSLTIHSSSNVLRRLYPNANRLDSVSEEDIADWLAELANVLIGRFLNRILALGFDLQVSTPSTMWGYAFRPSSAKGEGAISIAFYSGIDGEIAIRFEAVSRPDVHIDPKAKRSENAPIAEGDLVIF